MNTSNGGRFVDTRTHEAPRLPPTFRPDFGIEHQPVRRWYHRAPLISTFVGICGWAIVAIWVFLFVWRAVRNF